MFVTGEIELLQESQIVLFTDLFPFRAKVIYSIRLVYQGKRYNRFHTYFNLLTRINFVCLYFRYFTLLSIILSITLRLFFETGEIYYLVIKKKKKYCFTSCVVKTRTLLTLSTNSDASRYTLYVSRENRLVLFARNF